MHESEMSEWEDYRRQETSEKRARWFVALLFAAMLGGVGLWIYGGMTL